MRRGILAVLMASLFVAAEAPKKEAPKKPKLWAAISINRPVFEKGKTERLHLHLALVNDSDKTVNPEIESSQLLVNGKELKDWEVTVGNGPRDDRFEALPPGDHLLFGYALGKDFRKPGIYKLSWKGKNFESAEIVFRVLPSKER